MKVTESSVPSSVFTRLPVPHPPPHFIKPKKEAAMPGFSKSDVMSSVQTGRETAIRGGGRGQRNYSALTHNGIERCRAPPQPQNP